MPTPLSFSALTEDISKLDSHKGGDLITLVCNHCGASFLRRKTEILRCLRVNKGGFFCSPACQGARRNLRVHLTCKTCLKGFDRQFSAAARGENAFCSQSCAARHRNRYGNLDLHRRRRSKAEDSLSQLIRGAFPNITVQENVRGVLEAGLEIDILLPDFNLAIELNGPLHYFPIYGQAKLEAIQDRDLRKQVELQTKGFNLVVIDISQVSARKMDDFLVSCLERLIRPLLEA